MSTTSLPETAPAAEPPPPEAPPTPVMRVLQLVCFILGAGTFVISNVVLIVLAYPTLPNPGPQSDIRLPLFGLVAFVILITLLGRRPGVAFGAGFASGFVYELLFMSACVGQWADPGGTALADARVAQAGEAASVESEARAKEKWHSELRKNGLDLAVGVHRLETATGCLLDHRKKHGEYPAPLSDSLPDFGDDCWEIRRTKADESGWRTQYSRIAGPTGVIAGFRIRSGPDATLRMKGPVVEVDDRGIFMRRDTAGGPAFAVGSPLQPITAVVMDCIRKNSDVKPEAKNGVVTFRELIFYPRHCSRLDLQQVKTESGYVLDDPNIAWLFLPTTQPFIGFSLNDQSTSWLLTYVALGKTPADGYELHVRPLTYGFSGIRSYLITAGEIHATPEDRRATVSDPLAERCEMDPHQPCGN